MGKINIDGGIHQLFNDFKGEHDWWLAVMDSQGDIEERKLSDPTFTYNTTGSRDTWWFKYSWTNQNFEIDHEITLTKVELRMKKKGSAGSKIVFSRMTMSEYFEYGGIFYGEDLLLKWEEK